MKKFWKSANVKLIAIGMVVAVLAMSINPINVSLHNPLSGKQVNIEVGYVHVVLASGTLDYPLTQTGVQDALNALPATGGKLNLMNGSASTVNFTGTVSRAIPNVIIQGSGKAALYQDNAAIPLFSTGGQTGWVFRDMDIDAGGITLSSDTVLDNVHLGTTYYAYASTGTANFTTINAPTGRGATIFVASLNATAREKAQADYVCDGINDQNEIQTAINSLPAFGGTIELSSANFSIGATINVTADHVRIEGQGSSEYGFYTNRGYGVTALVAVADLAGAVVKFEGASYANMMIGGGISHMLVRGYNKVNPNTGVYIHWADVFKIDDLQIENGYYGLNTVESWAVGLTDTGIILNDIDWYVVGPQPTGHHWMNGGFIAHADEQGVYLDGAQVRNIRFNGVHFHDNGRGHVSGDGLYAKSAYATEITGCIFTDDETGNGIELDQATETSITGGASRGNAKNGVLLYGARDNTITGMDIANNDFANTASYDGVQIVNGGAGTSDNNIVSNSIFIDNDRYEINVISGSNNTIVNNNVVGFVPDHVGTISNTATLTHISGNVGYVNNGESVRVYNNAIQTVNDTTATMLTFNSERWDTDNLHSTVSNTSRLTAKISGVYNIVGNIAITGNATGSRILDIQLNGATHIGDTKITAGSDASLYLTVSTLYYLNTGDYVELEVYHDAGTALQTIVDANRSPEFSMALVSW